VTASRLPVGTREQVAALDDATRDRFLDIACGLSPENLWCDGEATATEARAKARRLTAEWKALEARVGFTVSDSVIYAIDLERNPPGAA
jgi:hypothetical protein